VLLTSVLLLLPTSKLRPILNPVPLLLMILLNVVTRNLKACALLLDAMLFVIVLLALLPTNTP